MCLNTCTICLKTERVWPAFCRLILRIWWNLASRFFLYLIVWRAAVLFHSKSILFVDNSQLFIKKDTWIRYPLFSLSILYSFVIHYLKFVGLMFLLLFLNYFFYFLFFIFFTFYLSKCIELISINLLFYLKIQYFNR